MYKLLIILSLFCLMAPTAAFAFTPDDVEIAEDVAAGEGANDWLELDVDLGLTGMAETFPSENTVSVPSFGAGELAGVLSLRLTDWGGEPCTFYCGPLWANRWGARLDVNARGVAVTDSASVAESSGTADLHIEESAEVALWFVSVGQSFSYQQDATFYQTFWRPYANSMSVGLMGGGAILSGADETGQAEVGSLHMHWRRVIGTNDETADELRFDIALVDGTAPPGTTWYERIGLGLVTVDLYGVPLTQHGQTEITEEAMNLVFDFGHVEGLRFWDAPWKLDATLGIAGMSPIAEVRRTTTTDPSGTMGVDYQGGPFVIAPHLWFAAHHVGENEYRSMPSVIFESIPDDADFGIGVGSFQRLDGSAFAVDVGAQVAAYARVPLTPDWRLRTEVLAITATRSLVSELAVPLPLQANQAFFMGRAEVGLDWAIAESWSLSANTWVEHSDRETTALVDPGPTSRVGVRAGLYFSY